MSSPLRQRAARTTRPRGGIFGALGAAGGGYANTAEGKIIVAAFTDTYNGLARAVRNCRAQEVKGGLGTEGQLEGRVLKKHKL